MSAPTSHVLCPHCLTLNRIPLARAGERARCGACHRALFDGKPTEVDESRFAEHLRRNDIPVLVDFWAPWCGPCRTMAPAFERAAAALEPRIRLLKLNVDEAQATAAKYGIRSIPTMILFHKDRAVAQLSGAQAADAITRWVAAHLPAQSPA